MPNVNNCVIGGALIIILIVTFVGFMKYTKERMNR